MDNRELNAAIKILNKAANDQEILVLPRLAVKAEMAAQKDPNDIPVVTASKILRKMASGGQLTISRADFNKLYDKLAGPQSALADLFSSELNREPAPGPKTFNRSDYEGTPLESDYEKIADPLLSNALKAAFEGKGGSIYSPQAARQAEKSAMVELNAIGAPPKMINVFAGQEDVIICKATYETPKGQSHVLIPVDFADEKALLPTMFFGLEGFQDITKDSLENHITTTAGKSYYVDGTKLLEILSVTKHGVKKIASDVELAVMRLKAEKQAVPHDPNGIVYMQVDNPEEPVQLPEAQKTQEHESFAKRLANPDGIARFVHGDRVIEAGRNAVIRKIKSIGYSNPQTKVYACDETRVLFDVNVGGHCGITVPVKIAGNKIIDPTVMIVNGELKTLSNENIVAAGFGDLRAIASVSPCYELSPKELYDRVKQALDEDNMDKAEEAINVLSQKDSALAKAAIVMFGKYLSGNKDDTPLEKTASEQPQEGVYWMSHKVFFPEGV